tara:strand:- start:20217 stop:20915 length:699 start_codon:yes stop_codon:yes gene_type:complete
MDIVLLYFQGCPNVQNSRKNLISALSQSKIKIQWKEYDLNDDSLPQEYRNYGSPSLIIDGKDVMMEGQNPGASCRVYSDNGKISGSIPKEVILNALILEKSSKDTNWKFTFGSIPAIFVALLPNTICPACWPLFGGLVSSLGIGFIFESKNLFILTIILLCIALFSLIYKARKRRGYTPFYLGLCSTLLLITGKFYWNSMAISYVGIAMLLLAIIWNSWPVKNKESCNACLT